MTMRQLTDRGELAGYAPGLPAGLRWSDGFGIDADLCWEGRCANCGRRGLEYHPYRATGSGWPYRAFAVCPSCHEAEEF